MFGKINFKILCRLLSSLFLYTFVFSLCHFIFINNSVKKKYYHVQHLIFIWNNLIVKKKCYQLQKILKNKQ